MYSLVADVAESEADQVDDQRTIGNQRSLSYPFAGIPSFLRTRIQADLSGLDSDIAVLGIPSDEGSPYLPGSRFGPRRIREHSLRFDVNGYYDGRADRTFLEHELTNGLIADAACAFVIVDPSCNKDALSIAGKIPVRHRMLLDERAVLRIELIGSHQNVGRTIAQADVVKYGAHADVCQLHF